jgi:hypothetical protein
MAAKGKTRARDNSGSRDLMRALQGAFESNWDSTDAPGWGPKKKTTKKPGKETAVALDDRDDEEDEREKSKKPTTSLGRALATAFTHNSANPNVAALASSSAPVPAEASRNTRRLAQETHAETSCDNLSVELSSCRLRNGFASPDVRQTGMSITHVPRRKRKCHLHTPTSSSRRKQQCVARDVDSSDEREQVDD